MIKTLSSYTDSLIIPQSIRTYLKTFRYTFNPSIIEGVKGNYLAIRFYNDQTKVVEAVLFFWNNGDNFKSINLSSYFRKEAGIKKVADPKLFKLKDGSICGTFNTGFTKNGNNAIFFFEIEGVKLKSCYTCQYNGRQKIEKNWVFYQANNTLHALYSLSPLKILKCTKVGENLFCAEVLGLSQKNNFERLSLGTPLLHWEGDRYICLAHKKYYFKGKRLYTGIPIIFDAKNQSITTQKNEFIHSFKSLLGAKKKFNKNLFSCTYFSGIMKKGMDVILTYGINDVSWNLTRIKTRKLWKL